MPSYLRQWLIHRHGGNEPVELVRGSAESDFLKKSTTKFPNGVVQLPQQEGELANCIIPCADLPDDVVYRSVAGIPISLQETPTSITLKGEAVCEVEQSFDNNSYIEKAKLTFLTLDDVPADQHPTFVIKTANDEIYLIGAKERPYPTIKITRSTGLPDGDASVRKYEVSFTAKKALALCNF